MDWNQIKNDPNYEINRALAQSVVANDPKAVHFYLTSIGFPIMRYIESAITHYDITAEFYLFLSHPYDDEEEKPHWHRVDLYKGITCSLSTYTSDITSRYFYRKVNQEKKRHKKEEELLEYVDYESLKRCETVPDDNEEAGLQMQYVRQAYGMLNDRDKMVIHCLIIKNMSAMEAFPILSPFMHPRPKDGMTSDEVKKSWTIKQCQDAISLIKGRALDKLQTNFIEIRNQNYGNR